MNSKDNVNPKESMARINECLRHLAWLKSDLACIRPIKKTAKLPEQPLFSFGPETTGFGQPSSFVPKDKPQRVIKEGT
jgi:hypothetical protein